MILNLKGGLGNQLFQLAAALTLNKSKKTYLYTGNLKKFAVPREFCLKPFIYSYHDEIFIVDNKWYINKYLLHVLAKINLFVKNDNNNPSRILILDGYFQKKEFFSRQVCEKLGRSMVDYFSVEDVKSNFLEKVSFLTTTAERESGQISKDYVGMHIRGTDRKDELNNKKFLESIENFVNKEKKMVCFTDDVEYAKMMLKQFSLQVLFVNEFNLTDIEEFYLISLFHEFFLGNSTFSICARKLSVGSTINYVFTEQFKERDKDLLSIMFDGQQTIGI
ncbi:alpha-1,2-fucosyltransferase [Nubsella zeaxanthinifaciens]|uniref:alpha-1,2-fucosyltransferase n=1 Tax=Nubsella zeaxanthinifaciens TaxID=392412 RepID=UPI000DE202F8|nr:alpha-1,2-fucosyltransferase [Nubsella zeaxanthinifaciens]